MSNKSIRLIVGLGNIGDAYRGTRHNAGFHFVDEVADEYGARFQADRKFFGDVQSTDWRGGSHSPKTLHPDEFIGKGCCGRQRFLQNKRLGNSRCA